MNKNTLNAVAKRYSSDSKLPENELKELLAKDDKNFDAEEIEEIYQALKGEIPTKSESKKAEKPKHLNDGLGLEDIDYHNFMPIDITDEDGEVTLKSTSDWQKYREIEKNLVANKRYKFQRIHARGQFRFKSDGSQTLIGLQIASFDPVNTPEMEARHVMGLFQDRVRGIGHTGLNSQIHNPDIDIKNSFFFILEKP